MKNFIIFMIGGCIGATASYFYCQKMFNNKLNEELKQINEPKIEEAKPEQQTEPETIVDKKAIADIHEKPDIFDYSRIAMGNKVQTIEPADEFTTSEEGSMQLISNERFEELAYEYQEQDLICYDDEVVTDMQDNVIYHSLSEMVSGMSLEDFDESGYLYVSDPDTQHIYEISKDSRRYEDVFDMKED